MSITPALHATLAMVADAMRDARDPWWIIGGAAVALHGADVAVGDVDVLVAIDDARMLAVRLGLAADPGPHSALFRSRLFMRWDAPPLVVEFMAGFDLHHRGPWHPITFDRRLAVTAGAAMLYVPQRDELVRLLQRIGRPKDSARATTLEALPT